MIRRIQKFTVLQDRWSQFALACLLLTCIVSCNRDAAEDAADASAGLNAREVVAKMFATYREAKAYSDGGAIHVSEARENRPNVERPAIPFAVALRRPNQLQLMVGLPGDHDAAIVGQSVVVSDGQQMRVRTEAQQEVLETTSSATIGIQAVEKALKDSIVGRSELPTPRLQMLLGASSIDEVFPDLDKAKLLDRESIGERACVRVALPTTLGDRIYWIDAESHLLRRIELSAKEANKAFVWNNYLNIAAVRLEYADAKFEADEDIERYRMDVGDDAVLVREWLPAPPEPLRELLGETIADYHFTDLDGKETTAKALADKIVVLDFWATWCQPCLKSLPKLNALIAKYKDNPKVEFLAVNTEEPSISNDTIRDVLANNKINMKGVRDLASFNRLTFGIDSLPTTIILDGSGKVQMIETAANETTIEATIESLLAGKDLATTKRREYREAIAEREKFLNKVLVGGAGDASAAKTAPESEPKKLKRTKLWHSTDLIQPGHIVVAESENAAPRVYIHDGWNSIAEISLDGKVAETYDLGLPDDSPVSASRTIVDSSGNRHFVAFATRQKQVHVFDNTWKLRFSYPDKDVTHPGIANVLLADLDGDKMPEINISFWGVAGIQSLSFEGKRLWPKRLIKSLTDTRGLAVTGADDKGQRRLVAAHYDPTLATFVYGGERRSDIVVPGHVLFDVISEDFSGQQKYCVLASGAEGEIAALGINEQGQIEWTHDLPGVPELVVEHVTTGMLPMSATKKERYWVLLAPDNSLQFVNAAGELLDQFNYGKQLHAVSVIEHEGKTILFASTSDGVDAWELSWGGE